MTEQLSERIATLRKEQGLTQEQLGRLVGVSAQAVSKWEKGGAPDVDLLPAIADQLGVSIDSLFGRQGGEALDMAKTLTAWLRAQSEGQRMQSLSRLFWEASSRGMTNFDVPAIDYPKSCEQPYNGEQVILRTCLSTDDGYVYGVPGEDMSFMCVFPEPEAGYERYMLDNDEYRTLFAALSIPGSLELLRHLCREGANFYIPSVAAKHTSLSVEETENVLAALEQAHLLEKIQLELEMGTVSAYTISDPNPVVPFLYFARWMYQKSNFYFMNVHGRHRTSLYAKEKKNDENR